MANFNQTKWLNEYQQVKEGDQEALAALAAPFKGMTRTKFKEFYAAEWDKVKAEVEFDDWWKLGIMTDAVLSVFNMKARDELQRGNLEAAIAVYEDAIRLESHEATAALAQLYAYRLSRGKECLALVKQFFANDHFVDAEHIDAYREIHKAAGYCQLLAHQDKKALSHYKKSFSFLGALETSENNQADILRALEAAVAAGTLSAATRETFAASLLAELEPKSKGKSFLDPRFKALSPYLGLCAVQSPDRQYSAFLFDWKAISQKDKAALYEHMHADEKLTPFAVLGDMPEKGTLARILDEVQVDGILVLDDEGAVRIFDEGTLTDFVDSLPTLKFAPRY